MTAEGERLFAGNARDYAVYGERGRACIEAGDWDQAIVNYNEALRANPSYFDGYINRGLAWQRKGRADHAIDDYGEAIRLQPDVASAYYNRALAWRDRRELGRAIADFSGAIRRNPAYHQAFYHRAICHAHNGDPARARDDFAQAVRLHPALGERSDLVGAFNKALGGRTSHPFLKAFACSVVGVALGAAFAAPLSPETLATAVLPALITGFLAWRSHKAWPWWRIGGTFVVVFVALAGIAAYGVRWQ